MDARDRMAIEALFAKLANVERTGQARDPEAEAFITERIAAQPGAPYYMAQTVIVQEQALDAAQQRIAELECLLAEGAMRQGRDKGGRFDNSPWDPAPRHHVPLTNPLNGQSRPAGEVTSFGAAGGFLTGAAQTAMGVAGGVLLASMISGIWGSDSAQAAEDPGAGAGGDWGDDPTQIEPADFEDDGFDFFGGDFEI